jgi:hypothetical protein
MVVQAAVRQTRPLRLGLVTHLLQTHLKETMAALRYKEVAAFGERLRSLVVEVVALVRLEEPVVRKEQTRKQVMAAQELRQALLVLP